MDANSYVFDALGVPFPCGISVKPFLCQHCCETHLHAFRRDEGVFEVYECLQCHQLNKVAVR